LKVIIVGAGISGLATGHALLARCPDVQLLILEAGQRTGGKVWTDRTDGGYACEWGVNGFLNNKPKTLQLSATLGLEAITGFEAANKRYVFRNNALHQLPESPPAFLTSGLMSLPGRLRVALEPFIGRGEAEDETLAEFGARRLGSEAFEALIDPMASGVFAGDPEKMSLKSCFPRINEIETEYGSLIRGMIRLQMKARREGKGKGPGPGPGGHLTSFAHGMSEMTDCLTESMGHRIRTGTRVEHISPLGDGYKLTMTGGVTVESDVVILASPAYTQARMLQDTAPDIALLLNGISYPPLSVVCIGYREPDLGEYLDGFGFLIPSKEKRGILGTIVDSNVFPNRAPQGSVLLRSMVGGSRSADKARLPDNELTDMVRSELKAIMGVDAEPEFMRVYRHEKAIPQYHVGHARRLLAIEEALKKHPGLVLTGNAFKGVSLNDCIQNAWLTAEKIAPGQ
jgi:oxygen-dependent protoporphyrinogen oxidase